MSSYAFVNPRLAAKQRSERRRCPRFTTDLPVHFQGRERMRAIDVSRDGLLVAADRLRPLRYTVKLTIDAPGGAFTTLGVVARHASDEPACMGIKLFGLGREERARWFRIVDELSHAAVTSDQMIEISLFDDEK